MSGETMRGRHRELDLRHHLEREEEAAQALM
jgi:hypothetical protein